MGATKVSHGSAIVCLFFILSASANAASAPPKPSESKHCLWRITNAKAPFYLLGSIHILRGTDYPLPPVVDQAIQQSQQFYFEFDPKRNDDYHRKLEAAAKLPHGVEIKDKVHAKTWEYLHTTARGGNFEWIHWKAWAIAEFVLDYPTHEPFRSALGVDNYVLRKADARNCPLRGLESVEDHVAVHAGMNDVEGEAYLLEAIVYASEREAHARQIIAAWKAGNTEQLSAIQDPVVREAPGLNPRFLEWRNTRWIPVIEKAINSGKPTLIVAGAGHFSGPHNVLGMLRARGYQIEQL
jgi:uncharacterized protein